MSGARAAITAPPPTRGRVACAATGWPASVRAIVLAWVLVALLAPWIAPIDPNFVDVANRLQPPSAAHLARHGRAGAGVLLPPALGLTRLAAGGFAVVLLGALFGTAGRHRRRLCPRLGGRGADAADRPRALLPADHPGACHRRGAWHRHARTPSSRCWWCGGRNSPASPAPCAGAARPGIRGGRGGAGLRPGTHPGRHIVPNAVGPLVGAGHARSRQRHPHLRGPVLPRPRRGAAYGGMGRHGRARGGSWWSNGGWPPSPASPS